MGENPSKAALTIRSAHARGSTLYRIHGSNEPWTIGTHVSSGCMRMTNEDVTDLYSRVIRLQPKMPGCPHAQHHWRAVDDITFA